jgi:PEGA domain
VHSFAQESQHQSGPKLAAPPAAAQAYAGQPHVQPANVVDPPSAPIAGPSTGVVARGQLSPQDAGYKLALHGVVIGTVLGVVLGLLCGVGVTYVVMRDRQPAMVMMQPMGVPQTVMVTPPATANAAAAPAAVRPRSVEVSATPAGADILVDGALVGKTPMFVRNVDWQVPHEVQLRNNGYQAQLLRVGPNDGFRPRGSEDVLPLHATLQTAAVAAAAPTPAETSAPAAAPSAHHDHHEHRDHHASAAVAKATPKADAAAADDGPKKKVKIPAWMTAGDSASSD